MADDPEVVRETVKRGIEAGYPQGIQENQGIHAPAAEPTPNKTTDTLEEGRRNIKNRTALMILELASHTLVLGLVLGSLWLIHLILEGLFGKDGKFFDYIPISWIIDAADLLVIAKFLWEIIKDFRRH